MNPQTLHYTLSIAETNLILEALSQAPYKQVFELIDKLQQVAKEQLAQE